MPATNEEQRKNKKRIASRKETKIRKRAEKRGRDADNPRVARRLSDKALKRAGSKQDRRQTKAALKHKRLGALDSFEQKMRDRHKLRPEGRPMAPPTPDQGPRTMPAVQPPVQQAQWTAGQVPQMGGMPPQQVQPPMQPPVQPPVQDPSVAQPVQGGVALDAYGQPVLEQPQVDPAQPAFEPGTMPPEQVDIDAIQAEQQVQVDPVTGAVTDQAADPTVEAIQAEPQPLLTPEEQQLANKGETQLDAAVAQGKQFQFRTMPMQSPETLQSEAQVTGFGTGAPVRTPRDMERLKRKRLAMLNPKIQQLRPWGRGLPQVRYQGGPAFEGAFGFGGGMPTKQTQGAPRPQTLQGARPVRREHPIVR
jgi:hypothetical protein